jgi:hypothetical protein
VSSPVPPSTPCDGCAYRPDCAAYEVLDKALYSKASFRRPPAPTSFLPQAVAQQTVAGLKNIAHTWLATADSLEHQPDTIVLPALFDFLLSALYAQWLFGFGERTPQRPALLHPRVDGGADAYFPYVWMCPACVAAGVAPASCYLPGSVLRAGRRYTDSTKLSRPGGRMIGDFGALALRIIIEAVAATDAHYAAGGGHRGEFDLVIATKDLLILGEIKASPLVAFPLVARVPAQVDEHEWRLQPADAMEWSLFVGAAGAARLPLSLPAGGTWPLPDFATIAADPEQVATLLTAWEQHLAGYRLFNAEDPATRWQRFGCGNIEFGGVQLRVDNTKSLPGIDRTDDIKKGLAQVMLFGRLKKGCHISAIKTVLFGNLFAETHHDHYMKPLASVKLTWPGEQSVWLFDGVLSLSRNIINDEAVAALFPLTNTPYGDDVIEPDEFAADLAEAADEGD